MSIQQQTEGKQQTGVINLNDSVEFLIKNETQVFAESFECESSSKPNKNSKLTRHSSKVSIIKQSANNQKGINYSESESSSPVVKQNKRKKQIIINLCDTKYEVVKIVSNKLKYKKSYDMEEEWEVLWTDNAVQVEQFAKMKLYQKINHFPGMYSLARKNYLGRSLMKMQKEFPKDYKFFPPTWCLPAEAGDFRNQFQPNFNKTFIIKPEASCQGRGIFLVRKHEDVPFDDHYVAQRYMDKPFLVDNLKFDLRIYVVLVGCDPLRIYIYDEGLARFATTDYIEPRNDNIENQFMHLTNYAINKDSSQFIFNEDEEKDDVGHKRSLTSIYKLLSEQGHDVEKLKSEINDILIKTFISGQPILAHNYRSCQPESYANNMCFEILGMDVLLDHKLKPWILEVNHTPSFSIDTPLDYSVKKGVIRDTLKLMNIHVNHRIRYKNNQKIQFQKRVMTKKKEKLTPEERIQMQEKCQIDRDIYEDKHLGGLTRIFPTKDPEKNQRYLKFQDYALKLYQDQTGANVRRNVKKPTRLDEKDMKNIQNLQSQKKQQNQISNSATPQQSNKMQQLDKIYSQNNIPMHNQSKSAQSSNKIINCNPYAKKPQFQDNNSQNKEIMPIALNNNISNNNSLGKSSEILPPLMFNELFDSNHVFTEVDSTQAYSAGKQQVSQQVAKEQISKNRKIIIGAGQQSFAQNQFQSQLLLKQLEQQRTQYSDFQKQLIKEAENASASPRVRLQFYKKYAHYLGKIAFDELQNTSNVPKDSSNLNNQSNHGQNQSMSSSAGFETRKMHYHSRNLQAVAQFNVKNLSSQANSSPSKNIAGVGGGWESANSSSQALVQQQTHQQNANNRRTSNSQKQSQSSFASSANAQFTNIDILLKQQQQNMNMTGTIGSSLLLDQNLYKSTQDGSSSASIYLSNGNGNYLKPKVMEFALNGLLKPQYKHTRMNHGSAGQIQNNRQSKIMNQFIMSRSNAFKNASQQVNKCINFNLHDTVNLNSLYKVNH